MTEERTRTQRNQEKSVSNETVDVLLVGGGIVSATLTSLITRAEPSWSVQVCERLDDVAAEASNGWNNSGTGHAALCELNYTPGTPERGIAITEALKVHEQFLVTGEYWSSLVKDGSLDDPHTFINPTPHMSFVRGEQDRAFLSARHEALTQHHFFKDMKYSADPAVIETWAPLLTRGRDAAEQIAATYAAEGTDVDFGSVTRQLFHDFKRRGGNITTHTEVTGLSRQTSGLWEVRMRDRRTGSVSKTYARTVLVGAGGWTLKLLRSAGAPEVHGYGLLPVSGTFLSTTTPDVVEQHAVKAYGKAPIGAPPMSMPHLDARTIDGKPSVLFGPFAGAIPKYLKSGSMLDFFGSLRSDNLWPLTTMGVKNLDLVSLLMRDLTTRHSRKVDALRAFAPSARDADWHSIVAGQRAQIVKPDARGRGVLQFGTEVVSSAEGTLVGVLGASPGASTAVPLALDVLRRSFPARAGAWENGALREYIPSLGVELADDAVCTERIKASIRTNLRLDRPQTSTAAGAPTSSTRRSFVSAAESTPDEAGTHVTLRTRAARSARPHPRSRAQPRSPRPRG